MDKTRRARTSSSALRKTLIDILGNKIENIINTLSDGESKRRIHLFCVFCVSVCSVDSYHLGWLSGGGSGSRRSLLWLLLHRQPVLRHLSSGTFLWHHKFLHFLWPALGGYKGHTWPVIVCLALSSVSLSSTAADFLQSQTLRLPEDTRISLDLDAGPIKALVYLMSDRCKDGFCSSVCVFVFFSRAPSLLDLCWPFRSAGRVGREPSLVACALQAHFWTCWYLLFDEVWGWRAEKKKD